MKIDFTKYLSPVFFETGSYVGDGIEAAIEAGFEEIYSIELSLKYHNICKERFKDNPNVHLIFGDSAKNLWEAIKDINKPITFWLDGHYSSGDTAHGKYAVPLIQELEQIKKHPINYHKILIDDIRLLRSKRSEFSTFPKSLIQIEDMLREINSHYMINY